MGDSPHPPDTIEVQLQQCLEGGGKSPILSPTESMFAASAWLRRGSCALMVSGGWGGISHSQLSRRGGVSPILNPAEASCICKATQPQHASEEFSAQFRLPSKVSG